MHHPYKARGAFKNGHVNTLYAHFFSRRKALPFKRERLVHDQGFSLYLDWVQQGNDNLIIFTHGLESSSNARYITSMGQQFLTQGYDVLAWNCRNCAEGEDFEKRAYYHSGISQDLDAVITHTLATQRYKKIVLVGFSMGGNILLKYLGEKGGDLPAQITRAMAVSSPLDLLSCSYTLMQFPNQIYGRNFLKTILQKMQQNTDDIAHYGLQLEDILQSKNLRDFDHAFTAPVHGFTSQDDYYQKASSLPLLKHIQIPTLILNALDDPILSGACYPDVDDIKNPHISTFYPSYGGHLGFNTKPVQGLPWLDTQALDFLL
ncbi:MAG: alpha/beta fold hydrolase [Pseudomonadales bacterium]|nr:alpha/beta fold hydrolase [Pseudomonadales bacterium]